MYKVTDHNDIIVDHKDTFTIPIFIGGHVPSAEEQYKFVVRRVNENKTRRNEIAAGDIVFEQTVFGNQLTPMTVQGESGFVFYVVATKEEAVAITIGENVYDLALIKDDFEIELIDRRGFSVREVNR